MSFGKRQQFGATQTRETRPVIQTETPQSTGKSIALGAATGVLGALALIALIVGGIVTVSKLQALELADRLAHPPADGPGYVNRMLRAKSIVDEECLGIWDNTLPGVRNTMVPRGILSGSASLSRKSCSSGLSMNTQTSKSKWQT